MHDPAAAPAKRCSYARGHVRLSFDATSPIGSIVVSPPWSDSTLLAHLGRLLTARTSPESGAEVADDCAPWDNDPAVSLNRDGLGGVGVSWEWGTDDPAVLEALVKETLRFKTGGDE